MMMQMLAEAAAGADQLIPGSVVTNIITTIGGLVLGVIGKLQIDKARAASGETPNKPAATVSVTTQEVPQFVTQSQLQEDVARIEHTLDEFKEALESERGIARIANGNIHKRIDAMSVHLGDRLASLEGSSRSVADTVGKLLDLALAKKPPGAR